MFCLKDGVVPGSGAEAFAEGKSAAACGCAVLHTAPSAPEPASPNFLHEKHLTLPIHISDKLKSRIEKLNPTFTLFICFYRSALFKALFHINYSLIT